VDQLWTVSGRPERFGKPTGTSSGGAMPLAITSRLCSGVVIVDLSGRLCFLDVALRESLNELLEEGHRAFVLNMANVSYVDSFGLGQLITVWTSVRNRGGQLILLRPTDHVQALFRLTKLNTIFHISGEEAQAIKSARSTVVESIEHILHINSSLP
jgi:anti-sigma B factor antagonist